MITFTNTECREFLKQLEPYRVRKTLTNGEKVSYIDFDQYLVDQRVVVRVEGYSAVSIVESKVGAYEQLVEKWGQANRYSNRVQYAKKADMESLQETL